MDAPVNEKKSYTHWVEVNGEIVGKAFLADREDNETRLVFIELPHLQGVAFIAAVNRANLRPIKMKEGEKLEMQREK